MTGRLSTASELSPDMGDKRARHAMHAWCEARGRIIVTAGVLRS